MTMLVIVINTVYAGIRGELENSRLSLTDITSQTIPRVQLRMTLINTKTLNKLIRKFRNNKIEACKSSMKN